MNVYLDNASTTQPHYEVLNYAYECGNQYGNPSSIHFTGEKAAHIMNTARIIVSNSINAKPHEVIFCGSGSEANSLAIKGFCEANRHKGNHIITSAIEHTSVLETCKHLETQGFEVTYLSVDKNGAVNIEALENAIRWNNANAPQCETILISLIFANNEVGTINKISEISELTKCYGVTFHTDAVQAYPHIDIDASIADMLTISSHKIHGIKGVGALYVRDGIELIPIIHGGGQEFGLRSGTENVSGIAGMGKAVEIMLAEREIDARNIRMLREMLVDGIRRNISDVIFNSPIDGKTKYIDSIVNVSFLGVDGHELVTLLSENGIMVSSGAACNSREIKASHVLLAMDIDEKTALSAIRFSLSKFTTQEDIWYTIATLCRIINDLRRFAF